MNLSVPPTRTSFVDRVSDLLARVDYREATSADDREAVFRLRYDCYLREGAIDPNEEQRFTDEFDHKFNSRLYGVFVDGELSSSLRVTVATREHPELPAQWAFSDIVRPMVDAGLVVLDSTRFVVSQEKARNHPGLAYLTLRLGCIAAEYFDADRAVVTARTEHQAFYKRVFGYRVECEARHYNTLKKPLSLMAVDYRAQRERVKRRYPFFVSNEAERKEIFEGLPSQRQTRPQADVAAAICSSSALPC